MRFAQPAEGPLSACIDGLRQRKRPDHAQDAVRFLDRQLFTPGPAMLEGAKRNDDGVNLGPLEPKANQPIDDAGRESPFNDAENLGLCCRRLHPEPVTDLDVGGINVTLLPTLCHTTVGKLLSYATKPSRAK